MAGFRNKQKSKDLSKINQDLGGLFNRLGLGKQVDGYRILSLWQTAIDNCKNLNIDKAILKSKTFAHKLSKNMELTVGVKSAALANELQFLKPNLLEALQQVCQQEHTPRVKAIIFELR